MPVLKCSNGKYRIGDGPCVYETREKADRAYMAYLARKHDGGQDKSGRTPPKRDLGRKN